MQPMKRKKRAQKQDGQKQDGGLRRSLIGSLRRKAFIIMHRSYEGLFIRIYMDTILDI